MWLFLYPDIKKDQVDCIKIRILKLKKFKKITKCIYLEPWATTRTQVSFLPWCDTLTFSLCHNTAFIWNSYCNTFHNLCINYLLPVYSTDLFYVISHKSDFLEHLFMLRLNSVFAVAWYILYQLITMVASLLLIWYFLEDMEIFFSKKIYRWQTVTWKDAQHH